MSLARVVRLLLLLVLPALALGVAAGGPHHPSEVPAVRAVTATISAPTQSLPRPVHNEATCAFCQAGIFPPCTPTTVSVPMALLGLVRVDHVSVDAQVPHTTAHRLAESRAPPAFRIV